MVNKIKKVTAKALREKTYKRKVHHFTEEELDEKMKNDFNDGRLNADGKWIDSIDKRIEELEKQVGIPELRKLKKDTRYQWKD